MLNDACTAIDERADELKQQGQKPLASGIAKAKELEKIALEAAKAGYFRRQPDPRQPITRDRHSGVSLARRLMKANRLPDRGSSCILCLASTYKPS